MEIPMKSIKDLLTKYKYPVLILVVGIVLMLIPSDSGYEAGPEEDNKLQAVLACTQGVGECRVITSDKGVVVVCRGAADAKVRLQVIKAVTAYTGFDSARITVLKMAE